jgi:hypothetical protein
MAYMENPLDLWRLPWSGDVTQAINPWSWWTSAMGQFGLVNISSSASANPQLERDIVGKVASYGRQLGRMTDVVYALLAHQDESAWSPDERRHIADFRRMADAIYAVKAGYAAPTDAALDRLIDGIRFLKEHNAAEYERVVGKLRRGLLDGAETPPQLLPPPTRPAAKKR